VDRDDSSSGKRAAAPSERHGLLWWTVAVIGSALGLAVPYYLMDYAGDHRGLTRPITVRPSPVPSTARPRQPERVPNLPSRDDWLSTRPLGKPAAPTVSLKLAARIRGLCSFCHLLPTPDVEPWDQWLPKIAQIYYYMRGPRPIPEERLPPMEEVVNYWASQTPDSHQDTRSVGDRHDRHLVPASRCGGRRDFRP
jgi:hypothetical protein